MGRPLKKLNFGDTSTAGPQLVVMADIGAGSEACWIVDQPRSNAYNLASVSGGATPDRTGLARFVSSVSGVGEMEMEILPFNAGATATATVTLIGASPAGFFGPVGMGYTPGDVLTLVGASNTPATVTVISVSPGVPPFVLPGAPTAYSITTPGDYSIIPLLSAPPPFGGLPTTGGTGVGAQVSAAFELLAVTVTDGGTGYTAPPVVLFGGIAGATGTAALTGDAVTSITIGVAGTAFPTITPFAVIPSIAAPGVSMEQAKQLNQHTVKTFEDNVYSWKLGIAATAVGQADIPFS